MDPRLFCEPRLCRAAFRVLDADADGVISAADLEKILDARSSGDDASRSRLAREILAEAAARTKDSTRARGGIILTKPPPGGAAAAAAPFRQEPPPPGGGIDFATFCEVMLPKNVEPSLANKIAEYMSKSFV